MVIQNDCKGNTNYPADNYILYLNILCHFTITKHLLQELPQPKRVDAVSSMVYEANARSRDPVYGCAGTISQLHKQVNDLKAELAMAQAELFIMQCQQQQQNANASFFLDRYLVSDYC